jgi:fumarate reductase (CoM/CoB) subunit B
MKNPDQCCGAGGGVRSGRRELSDLIRADKVKMILETGAEAVVTECPFCVIQLRDALDEAGRKDIEVFYLEELIKKAM